MPYLSLSFHTPRRLSLPSFTRREALMLPLSRRHRPSVRCSLMPTPFFSHFILRSFAIAPHADIFAY